MTARIHTALRNVYNSSGRISIFSSGSVFFIDIAYCSASHSLAFSRVSNNLMSRPVSLSRDWMIIHLTPVTPTTALAFMYGVIDLNNSFRALTTSVV